MYVCMYLCSLTYICCTYEWYEVPLIQSSFSRNYWKIYYYYYYYYYYQGEFQLYATFFYNSRTYANLQFWYLIKTLYWVCWILLDFREINEPITKWLYVAPNIIKICANFFISTNYKLKYSKFKLELSKDTIYIYYIGH